MNDLNLHGLVDFFGESVAAKLYEKMQKGGGTKAPARRLLPLIEAADCIGRTVPAVRSLINTGQIPSVQADRRIFLGLQVLDAWTTANKN